MKQELQEKLYKTYPSIFKQKDLTCQETAMCWGFACDDGWYTLIDELCGNIENRLQNVNRNKPKDDHLICEAVQVKEKFGGLRFYIYGGDDYISGLIDLAESLSRHICSKCGNKSDHVNKIDRGWIHTLCTECKKE
jgi:hypothetical protein